jgi:OmpA-OmpF porin, OOP family
MEGHFDWHQPAQVRGRESFLPPPDRIGWWLVVSLLAAIIIHIILFISLGHIKMEFGWSSTAEEIVTEPVMVRPVEEEIIIPEAPPEEISKTAEPDRTKLVDDVEILEQLKDPELTMKPDATVAEFNVDIKMEAPALAGDPLSNAAEIAASMEISASDLTSLGKMDTPLPKAADGQMIVDPGADVAKADPLDSYMEELIRKGNQGTSPHGVPGGTSTLDEIAGLPENVLVGKTTMLPGDLLFEFNSATLQSGCKVAMQKIALVMDRNPNLYCWIDGHTDLVGGDAFNYDLSRRRAESVKQYLVGIGMDGNKIITRGMGKTSPIVISGTQEEQSINRRVELKMRKTLPPAVDPIKTTPLKALPIDGPEAPVLNPPIEPAPPKATLVKPQRALPVEELPSNPPRAKSVQETPPPRASAIIEELPPPRVLEEKPPLRAEAVEE